MVLQNLPIFQFDEKVLETGDTQLTNSVYLDNSTLELYEGRIHKRLGSLAIRLRWYGDGSPKLVFVERKTHRDSWTGEESVKERFTLQEKNVVPFMRGEYTLKHALRDMKAAGKEQTAEELASFTTLFTEVQTAIISKQLEPTMRTQYMRVAYQIPFDATVRVSLDTNLCMMNENPSTGPSTAELDRWYRDPLVPVQRTDITRFPHAVLEVKLALKEGDEPPVWVQNLLNSGMLTEVHKFSKFLHGCATLLPDSVFQLPYWIDDKSLQLSMLRSQVSAEDDATEDVPRVSSQGLFTSRGQGGQNSLREPLLGRRTSGVQLMHDNRSRVEHNSVSLNGARPGDDAGGRSICCWPFCRGSQNKQKPRVVPMRVEPKTYMANERTFLQWLHMSVTLGSIGGFKLVITNDDGEECKGMSLDKIAGMTMIYVAVIFTLYALRLYYWRSKMISRRLNGHFDDRFGPFFMGSILLCMFLFIMYAQLSGEKC
eukprot:g4850.t1